MGLFVCGWFTQPIVERCLRRNWIVTCWRCLREDLSTRCWVELRYLQGLCQSEVLGEGWQISFSKVSLWSIDNAYIMPLVGKNSEAMSKLFRRNVCDQLVNVNLSIKERERVFDCVCHSCPRSLFWPAFSQETVSIVFWLNVEPIQLLCMTSC